ncbi:MAG: ISLre2 family transposase [Acidobacteriota bacterium]|jgi:hypothetical protein
MDKVTYRVETFKDLVGWVLRRTVQEMVERLALVLAAVDEEVHNDPEERKRRQGWESIGKRERSMQSLLGLEVRFARRGYRRVGPDGRVEYRWPLDELLGLAPEERFCPLVQQMAVGLAAQSSFREAAAFLREYLQVPVSHQQVHRWVQAAGARREMEEQEQVAAVFERGEALVSEGQGAAVVVFEGDGMNVHLQREKADRAELKLCVMHEGWVAESPANRRYRLVKKVAVGGSLPTETLWQRVLLRFHGRYDAAKVGRVVVNGDGAGWVKAARAYLDGAEVYLDPYHRNQALRNGLGFAPDLLERAHAAIAEGNLDSLRQVLVEALGRAPGEEHVQRVKELRRYLRDNWDGLCDWRQAGKPVPEGARGLGAAEPQISHVLSRRMKKRGMSWRIAGAHRMALLRCLHAEGALAAWLERWATQCWSEAAPASPPSQAQRRQVLERLERTDPAEWLRGQIPLLAAGEGRTELGRLLKRLSSLDSSLWDVRFTGQPAAWGGRIVPPQTA